MDAGTILYHTNFTFKDGEQAPKLLVVLNEPDLNKNEPYIVSKTTSNPNRKSRQFGCDESRSLFFFPQSSEWFSIDSWLQLYDLYEFDAKSLLQDRISGVLEIKDHLKDLSVRQIKNCIKRLQDVSLKHKKLILRATTS